MPAPNDREELRIALVMGGGVSLAVWIGGVTYEIGRLVADTGHTVYSELCNLTAMAPRVDVIAGTSAGGINGAYLAMAMACHQGAELEDRLAALRDLWIDGGSFAQLLRSPFRREPPSLLDGDGYFLGNLRAAFKALRAGATVLPVDQVPIELLLTTTLLDPEMQTRADDFGVRIADASHQARLHFSRRRPKDGNDDFADATIDERLALAARCTSSFPAAFEPSFCPIGPGDATAQRPDMAAAASFTASGFVIDGGVLDNQPLDAALSEIFRQRATGPVRRVLAHVVPDPGGAAPRQAAAAPPATPDMLDVLMSSLVRIPLVQSIGGQIDGLRAHNAKVRERRCARVLLTSCNTPLEIDGLAATLFAAYRAVRLETAVDYILERIEAGLLRAGYAGLGQSGRRDWLHEQIVRRMDTLPWLPQRVPDTSATAALPAADAWRWGTRPIEHSVRVLIDLLTRAQRLARLVPRVRPGDPAHLPSDFLAAAWTRAFALLENTGRLRGRDAEHWSSQSDAVRNWLGSGRGVTSPPPEALEWLNQAIDGWQRQAPGALPDGGSPTNRLAAQYAAEIGQALIDIRPSITDLLLRCAAGDDPQRMRQVAELSRLYGYFLRVQEQPTVGAIVGRLLAFEVVQEALGGRGTMPEEEIDFIQLSAQGASSFGGPGIPAEKLAGVQLAHFGAFYKRSWRANDWMWGRLDAVRRLVRILLDPEVLRIISLSTAQGQRAGAMANRIADIALGDPGEARDELLRSFSRDAIAQELGYLDHPNDVMPEFLEASVGAVCRRIELDILQRELPLVANAVQQDQLDGSRLSETVKSFLIASGIPPRDPVPAAQVRAMLAGCRLGLEKIEDDVGTDRLTAIAAQTTAVAISAMARQDGWLTGFGKMMAVLRTPSLLFYLFAMSARLGSRTGLASSVAVFVAGAAIVATAPFATSQYPDWLLLAGIAAFFAGGLFLVVRVGLVWRILLLVGAAAAIAWFVWYAVKLPDLPPAIWVGVGLIEVLVLAAAIFGRLPLPPRQRI
ncbi:MAG TPA: patatin-like protein [Acetobacteraceae bacterium]|nr:patatin-like protein [Acetobacteraceae bacterium]